MSAPGTTTVSVQLKIAHQLVCDNGTPIFRKQKFIFELCGDTFLLYNDQCQGADEHLHIASLLYDDL